MSQNLEPIQDLPELPVPPNPASDSKQQFISKAEAFTRAQKQFGDQLNSDFVPKANGIAADVNVVVTNLPAIQAAPAQAAQAADSATAAAASAATATEQASIATDKAGEAHGSAQAASASETAAAGSAATATEQAVIATDKAEDAARSAAAAQAARDAAEASRTAAKTSETNAAADAATATQKAADAADSAAAAHASKTAAETARVAAETARDEAQAIVGPTVPPTRKITAGTGLSGGGDLSADRALAVKYGTAAGTVCQGNDERLTDTRDPKTHAASHQAGGADAIATVTPAANAIPQAGPDGKLATGWLPAGGIPVGATVMYPDDLPEPDGWLRCNGGDFGSRYPALAAALGGTTLPTGPRDIVDVTRVDSGSPDIQWTALATNPLTGDIWAASLDSGKGDIHVRYGGGDIWVIRGTFSLRIDALAVDKHSGDVWACGQDFLGVLREGKGEWQTITSLGNQRWTCLGVGYHGDRSIIMAGCEYNSAGTVYSSSDNGATWGCKSNKFPSLLNSPSLTYSPYLGVIASGATNAAYMTGNSMQHIDLTGVVYSAFDGHVWGYMANPSCLGVVMKNSDAAPVVPVSARIRGIPACNQDTGDIWISTSYGLELSFGVLLGGKGSFRHVWHDSAATGQGGPPIIVTGAGGDVFFITKAQKETITQLRVRTASGIIKAA